MLAARRIPRALAVCARSYTQVEAAGIMKHHARLRAFPPKAERGVNAPCDSYPSACVQQRGPAPGSKTDFQLARSLRSTGDKG